MSRFDDVLKHTAQLGGLLSTPRSIRLDKHSREGAPRKFIHDIID